MMKKSTCILSIPTLCAMILLMAQGLFGEVRATFTATVSCNVSPEVELVTGFLEFWLDDVEFEVTGLPDNEYYIPDYDITIDQDRDWLSDSYEDNHGFDKTKQDTDNNGVKDLEEESIAAESNWTNDSHNNQDWSKPGKNSGN